MKGLDSLAQKLIDKTSREVDKIAEARIKQAINKGGQQIQKIAPNIIRGAIEDVYKTPFRLLGNSKKHFASEKEALEDIKTKMNEGSITDKIYQGCATRYKNGKRKLIDFEKDKKFLMPSSYPFWGEDIRLDCTMQTRSSIKKRRLIKGPFKIVK